MKIPAIRNKVGNWIYYVSSFTFKQISEKVTRRDEEFHDYKMLMEQIEKGVENDYHNISTYILSQEERFFNALVLAVYDGNPQWVDVEHRFEDGSEFFNMGFLTFNGKEKIFPIDGQHRVEGIKEALKKDSTLEDESVPVILIGHRSTTEGIQRSRRLFTTLNRYYE